MQRRAPSSCLSPFLTRIISVSLSIVQFFGGKQWVPDLSLMSPDQHTCWEGLVVHPISVQLVIPLNVDGSESHCSVMGSLSSAYQQLLPSQSHSQNQPLLSLGLWEIVVCFIQHTTSLILAITFGLLLLLWDWVSLWTLVVLEHTPSHPYTHTCTHK